MVGTMKQISDGQVEVAVQAYWSVAAIFGVESRKPMRAALEAYERVRNTNRKPKEEKR